MQPWTVLAGIVLVAAVFVLVPVATATFSRFRGAWRVRCPEEDAEARITLDAGAAARGEIFGRADVRTVVRCSSWPERQGCQQTCLTLPLAEWRRPRPGERPPRRPGADERKTFLVPLDGTADSERALGAAADLARACDGRLRLLRVARPPTTVRTHDRIVAFVDQEATRVEYEASSYLAHLAAGLSGVAVDRAVRFGDPGTEIVRDAEDAGAEMIVMTAHPRHGLQRIARRSVMRRVLRGTDAAVLLVPGAAA